MNKRLARFSISAAAVLVLAAGCSSNSGPAGVPGPAVSPSSVPSVSMTHSPSHSPQVVGAVKSLDANSVALAKTLGSAYPDAEKPFLASWR